MRRVSVRDDAGVEESGRLRPLFYWLALVAAVSSCGTLGSSTTSERAVAMVRLVAPFAVLDVDGNPYDLPFLGGMNVPRPQFVDIDADGDLDLFLEEHSGEVSYYENTGTAQDARFAWRTDDYASLEVGDWYHFVDLDSDGDFDLLTERRFSRVRYYRNDGTKRAPRFVMAEDTLLDVAGEPVFSDRQNNPNVADIDCDGKDDLFIGRLDGSVTRYELDHIDERGIPRFRFVEDRFQGISIVAQFGSMHGANGLAFYDFDGDGDLDFFWGDFFEAGLLLIENTGTCSAPNLHGEPVRFPFNDPVETSGYNVPVFADLDADGDQDLVMAVLGGAFDPNRTSASNLYYFRNEGDAGFKLITKRFIKDVDLGTESYPILADIDGDSDLDLLVSNKIDPAHRESSRLVIFRNVGTPTSPSFREESPRVFGTYYHYAPALGDLDGDGDLDMLLGTWNKGISLFWNEGTAQNPNFVESVPSFVKLTRGSNCAPELADMDADSDLDLFVGEASGALNYYRNEGSPASPSFVLVSDEFQGIDVGRRSVPRALDLDDDGDLDLVIGSETGETFVFLNAGTVREPHFVRDSTQTFQLPVFATPFFADLDGDGDQDLISGGDGGGLVFYEARRGSLPSGRRSTTFMIHE